MIKKILNGIAGSILVMIFYFQTAQGMQTSEILADDSNVQPGSSKIIQESNQTEPLPDHIIGLPRDIWENYILNEWLLPQHVATVSRNFGDLARKMTYFKMITPDQFDKTDTNFIHYKDLLPKELKTFRFVNLFISASFSLDVGHIKYLLGEDLNVSYLNLVRNVTCLNLNEDDSDRPISNAIGDCLKTNTSLVSLNLAGCTVDKRQALAIHEGLKLNTTLKELNLNFNKIDQETCDELKKNHPKVEFKFKRQSNN